MSENPLSYATPHYQPNRRPGGVVAIAVVTIIWASLKLLCAPANAAFYFIKLPKPSPGLTAIRQHHTLFAVIMAIDLFSVLTGIPLLCAGIAALKLRPWSRRVILILAVLSLAQLAVNEIVIHGWMVPIQRQATPVAKPRPTLITPVYSQIAATLILLAYPVAMLIVLTRPKIKAAFAERLESAA